MKGCVLSVSMCPWALKGIGQKCGRAEKSAGLRAFFPSVRFETFRQSKNKSIIRMKRCVLSVSMCPWAWRALAINVVELRKVQVCCAFFPSVRFETFRQSKNKSIIRMKGCVLSVSMCPWAWRALAMVELRKVQVCVPSFLLSGLRHSDSQRTSLSSEWSGVCSLSPCVLGTEGHWPW